LSFSFKLQINISAAYNSIPAARFWTDYL